MVQVPRLTTGFSDNDLDVDRVNTLDRIPGMSALKANGELQDDLGAREEDVDAMLSRVQASRRIKKEALERLMAEKMATTKSSSSSDSRSTYSPNQTILAADRMTDTAKVNTQESLDSQLSTGENEKWQSRESIICFESTERIVQDLSRTHDISVPEAVDDLMPVPISSGMARLSADFGSMSRSRPSSPRRMTHSSTQQQDNSPGKPSSPLARHSVVSFDSNFARTASLERPGPRPPKRESATSSVTSPISQSSATMRRPDPDSPSNIGSPPSRSMTLRRPESRTHAAEADPLHPRASIDEHSEQQKQQEQQEEPEQPERQQRKVAKMASVASINLIQAEFSREGSLDSLEVTNEYLLINNEC